MENSKPEVHEKTKHEALPEYDSNPFTISFRGFGLMVNYAKGVVITVIILAVLQFVGNLALNIVSTIVDSNDNRGNLRYESGNSATNNIIDNRFEVENDYNDYSGSINGIQDSLDDMNDLDDNSNSSDVDINVAAIILGVIIFIIIIVIILLIAGLFTAAMGGFVAAGAVAATQKREISFTEALTQMMNRFGTLYYATIFSMLRVIGGSLLFIIPGIRASLRYQALPYIIMNDDKISGKEALAKSKLLYKNHLMEAFGISFVGSIIPVIGSTIAAGGMVLSVNQIESYRNHNKETPKTHWLNYIGIILAGILILLIVLGALALFSLASSN